MARQKKLTPWALARIPSWIEQGLSADEIARKVGCTTGTLRVRCSQLKISFRENGRARAPALQAAKLRRSATEQSNKRKQQPATKPNGAWKERLLVRLSEKTLHHLHSRAASTGLTDARLAATLLEKIAQDNLYDAVLDE